MPYLTGLVGQKSESVAHILNVGDIMAGHSGFATRIVENVLAVIFGLSSYCVVVNDDSLKALNGQDALEGVWRLTRVCLYTEPIAIPRRQRQQGQNRFSAALQGDAESSPSLSHVVFKFVVLRHL